MSKSRDAFRTISEVAELLETPAHVLRFWETKFTQVKPVKRAGGRRYYRPNDVALLAGIRQLLHDDGLTIKGVQKVLREQGVKHVAAIAPPPGLLDESGEDVAEAPAAPTAAEPAPQQDSATVLPFAQPQAALPEAESEASAEPAPAPQPDSTAPDAPLFAEASDPEPQTATDDALWQPDPQANAEALPADPVDTPEEPLPDFLTQSLEDRGATPLPEAGSAEGAADTPAVAAPLPEVAQLDSLPQPASGPLTALATAPQLTAQQAVSARAQLAALRAFVAARDSHSAA
ncbi:MerR family transcriptional regulator [Salipiger sp. PrR002]|uniref:MerR family transcriptional regulator n=1 Tax=Salipiger sp. PrR002 TaxID=2706489 RepID=UPI0013B8A6A7|nr:MerR family transcriptional regulator [Salipiger sp. PrR002]NDV99565.1 MerR family transcriptional regulator [Salipiger sp. PrR002]NDW57211.1 MerR family transcriptional regulator [Salipiger sp. PrR004]